MVSLKETDYEVTFEPETMTFWQKIKWCIRVFTGFKTKLKIKIKYDERDL